MKLAATLAAAELVADLAVLRAPRLLFPPSSRTADACFVYLGPLLGCDATLIPGHARPGLARMQQPEREQKQMARTPSGKPENRNVFKVENLN
eukprot:CAMPEP_0172866166 /NCGR_PEP_ID=MMETSP1075-20121228/81830_1 /TAXON_ID=2916 /ORGANISM="Ceratium fusus, Strain PA161109" /LENGTH=92 /DNA_ID=CAMNT_0013715299 /DNA_START=49 /DNA_END=325 /DNA_ORIENTATION=-